MAEAGGGAASAAGGAGGSAAAADAAGGGGPKLRALTSLTLRSFLKPPGPNNVDYFERVRMATLTPLRWMPALARLELAGVPNVSGALMGGAAGHPALREVAFSENWGALRSAAGDPVGGALLALKQARACAPVADGRRSSLQHCFVGKRLKRLKQWVCATLSETHTHTLAISQLPALAEVAVGEPMAFLVSEGAVRELLGVPSLTKLTISSESRRMLVHARLLVHALTAHAAARTAACHLGECVKRTRPCALIITAPAPRRREGQPQFWLGPAHARGRSWRVRAAMEEARARVQRRRRRRLGVQLCHWCAVRPRPRQAGGPMAAPPRHRARQGGVSGGGGGGSELWAGQRPPALRC